MVAPFRIVDEIAMTPDVVGVTPLPEYQLEAVFAVGDRCVLDMRPYLGYPAFTSLAEGGLFMKAHVVLGTVAWTDEIDVSPETLYWCGRRLPDQSTPRAHGAHSSLS